MSSELLEKAIELSKTGYKKDARDLLRKILREDPNNELAWIWFADTHTTVDERLKILQRGLKTNPNSQRLKQAVHTIQRTKDEITRIKTLSNSAESYIAESISRWRSKPRVEHISPPPVTFPAKTGKKKLTLQWLILIVTVIVLWQCILWVSSLVGSDDSNTLETFLLNRSEVVDIVGGNDLTITHGPTSPCSFGTSQAVEIVTECTEIEFTSEVHDDRIQITLIRFSKDAYAIEFVDGMNAYYRRTNLESTVRSTETGYYWLYGGFPDNSLGLYYYGLAAHKNTAVTITRQSESDLVVSDEKTNQVLQLLEMQLEKGKQEIVNQQLND